MGLSVINATLNGEMVNLRAGSDVIDAIGPGVTPQDGDDVLDATGHALVGPMINGHGHAAMTLLRGYGSDLQLQEWLQHKIWPAEANLTDDDCYWGVRLAALEMIRSGTTHFYDMYWHPTATARAAEDAGIRATVGAPLFDGNNAAGLAGLRDMALQSLDGLAGFGPLITPSLTPHANYTVSKESLEWVANEAAARDLIVHIHLCETVREVDDWMTEHDVRPVPYIDAIGLLGPKTILAHGCVMEPEDYALVAERGATIVTNPVSNLKLANGRVFPYPTASAAGVAIGLGTDGASSNNSLDLLADLKTFALVQKDAAYDPTVLPAGEALDVAQGRRAPLLGGRPIEVGAPADFLLIDTERPEMNPGSLVDNLVYAANGGVVDSTVVAGKVVMRHRAVEDADEVVAQARRCAARLLAAS